MNIHSLQSIHAYQEGDKAACPARGTKQVTVNSWEVNCPKCQAWDDRNTCYVLSAEAAAYVKTLECNKEMLEPAGEG
mgnify:FL=1